MPAQTTYLIIGFLVLGFFMEIGIAARRRSWRELGVFVAAAALAVFVLHLSTGFPLIEHRQAFGGGFAPEVALILRKR